MCIRDRPYRVDSLAPKMYLLQKNCLWNRIFLMIGFRWFEHYGWLIATALHVPAYYLCVCVLAWHKSASSEQAKLYTRTWIQYVEVWERDRYRGVFDKGAWALWRHCDWTNDMAGFCLWRDFERQLQTRHCCWRHSPHKHTKHKSRT